MSAVLKAKPRGQGARGPMLAKLATSLLDDQDARCLMMVPVPAAEMQKLGFPAVDAFELPYFKADGRPSGFKRWRFLGDTRSAIEQKTKKKPLRYVQEGDTVSEVYMPPLTDWPAVQADPGIRLVITEGELKAACATKLDHACLGLGGVYSFKSTKRKLPLLPIFYDFKWKGRDVIVAFDSDAHTNPMVVSARNELCRELLAMGALPRIAEVTPNPETGGRRGLDDMALEDGAEELERVLDEAQPYATSAALHELNAEVAYVKDPGLVVVLDTGKAMRASDFTGHAYSNRHYWETTLVNLKDGGVSEKSVKKKAAPAWLDWPSRLELDGMAFRPGQPRITEDRRFNTWKEWGCQPVKGDVGPWKKLLDRLFGDKKDERRWFERWCALPLQRPGSKMYTAAVLWGVRTGTGKSLVGVTLGRIYGKAFTLIGDKELQDQKNAWAEDKLFVLGDDVTGQDQRKYADQLKARVTQEFIRIDQKYVPSYSIPDLINYLFTSNHPDAFFLEDDDRRNFVHEVLAERMGKEEVHEYKTWLRGDGPSHLFHHLLNLDLGDMEAEDRAPETDARASMIEDGLSDLGRWVRKLRDDPGIALRLGDAEMPGDLWSAAELVRMYDPEGKGRATAGGLGKELKRAGFRQVYGGMPVKTSSGQARLFAVRNREQWLASKSMREIAAHHDETRGLPGRGGRKKY